jgi:RpiR family carbohydrate utilization transcriptional regulator
MLLDDIHRALPTLSRAERSVGEWILANPQTVMAATLSDIAAATGISEPTVVRFCRSVGAAGFRDFKLSLAADAGRRGSYVHRDVRPDDSIADAVIKVIDGSISALHELRSRAASLPFDEAVAILADARQIVFAGLGASGQVAADACQKFFRLGIPATTATDGPTLLQIGAVAEPADVFVAVSHNGRWPALVDAMDSAARNGASVIALTHGKSPLAAHATLVFENRIAEDTGVYTPMSSRLAHLALLDALQVALAIRLGPVAEQRLRASKQAITGG